MQRSCSKINFFVYFLISFITTKICSIIRYRSIIYIVNINKDLLLYTTFLPLNLSYSLQKNFFYLDTIKFTRQFYQDSMLDASKILREF